MADVGRQGRGRGDRQRQAPAPGLRSVLKRALDGVRAEVLKLGADLLLERFGRERPAVVVSIGQRGRQVEKKKAERTAARAACRVEVAASGGPS